MSRRPTIPMPPAFHLEDVAELASWGESWESVAARVGSSRSTVEQSCRRAGRLDILDRLALNSRQV